MKFSKFIFYIATPVLVTVLAAMTWFFYVHNIGSTELCIVDLCMCLIGFMLMGLCMCLIGYMFMGIGIGVYKGLEKRKAHKGINGNEKKFI